VAAFLPGPLTPKKFLFDQQDPFFSMVNEAHPLLAFRKPEVCSDVLKVTGSPVGMGAFWQIA